MSCTSRAKVPEGMQSTGAGGTARDEINHAEILSQEPLIRIRIDCAPDWIDLRRNHRYHAHTRPTSLHNADQGQDYVEKHYRQRSMLHFAKRAPIPIPLKIFRYFSQLGCTS